MSRISSVTLSVTLIASLIMSSNALAMEKADSMTADLKSDNSDN